jgi:hypothetical protein
MPNWVSNTLTVSCPANNEVGFDGNAEMKEFLSLVGKEVPSGWVENDKGEQTELRYEDSGGFSFLAFVAPPADKIEEYFGKKGWENGEEVGNTEYNWYNWNLSNWGCKWDCNDVCVYTEESESPSFFQVQFQTPWSPPEQFLENLMNKFTSLDITLNWEEEQGFGAEWSASDPDENGERSIVIEEQWDIPDSHADYTERDRECQCSWDNDPNDWYEDCPDRAEALLDWNKQNGIIDPNAQEPDLIYG